MILLSAEASLNEISTLQSTETNVISLAFCESSLPAEENMGKTKLEEVHSYAELKDDPRPTIN